VEPGPDIRQVVNELERAPDAVILPFLARLRTRRMELAHALQGRILRLELVIEGKRRTVYRLVFTSTGNVELTGAHGFEAHVRLAGEAGHVVGVVVGSVDTFTAVYERVLTLLQPAEDLPQYPAVRRLLADEVRSCRSGRRR
jgi:hypothetical protein